MMGKITLKQVIIFIIEIFIVFLPGAAIIHIFFLTFGENPQKEEFAILNLTLGTYMILCLIICSDLDEAIWKIVDKFTNQKDS